ncbi:Acyl-CoA Binding Protein [Zostera marina]|uniref:Acyl-CoA Binding Protein n=1 Tax=Zostera marina TaxID=29655 RepID=A0A0K9NS05_ZOSMR|nr:Acyl-CoA Binding Protein [Zostera marina]
MELQEDFEEHAKKIMTLTEEPSNDDKLILYGLFKQASFGPVTTDRPGIFKLKERAKWDAWKAVEGKSKEDAMNDYIIKVKQMMEC